MKTFKIKQDVVEGLLAYLLSRPMMEVEAGVIALRNLEEIKEVSEKPCVPEKK